MKVLVTGASGFAGSAVVSELLRRGHDVVAFDAERPPGGGGEGPTAPQHRGTEEEARVEVIAGDVTDYATVEGVVDGCDAIITAHAYFGGSRTNRQGDHYLTSERGEKEPMEVLSDPRPWLVMQQGLWNLLEAARWAGVARFVHISSCATVWPGGPSSEGKGSRQFTRDARSQEGDVYGLNKRLQEELCRAVHDHCRLPIVVLRPDGIIDARQGLLGHPRRAFLGPGAYSEAAIAAEQEDLDRLYSVGAVCRHDLAAACVRAAELRDAEPVFEILHTVGASPEALAACNVGRTQLVLGVEFAAPSWRQLIEASKRNSGSGNRTPEAKL